MALQSVLALSQTAVWLVVGLWVVTGALVAWLGWLIMREPRTPENQTDLLWLMFIFLTGGFGAIVWFLWLLVGARKKKNEAKRAAKGL